MPQNSLENCIVSRLAHAAASIHPKLSGTKSLDRTPAPAHHRSLLASHFSSKTPSPCNSPCSRPRPQHLAGVGRAPRLPPSRRWRLLVPHNSWVVRCRTGTTPSGTKASTTPAPAKTQALTGRELRRSAGWTSRTRRACKTASSAVRPARTLEPARHQLAGTLHRVMRGSTIQSGTRRRSPGPGRTSQKRRREPMEGWIGNSRATSGDWDQPDGQVERTSRDEMWPCAMDLRTAAAVEGVPGHGASWCQR